jgi:hypothetical protein
LQSAHLLLFGLVELRWILRRQQRCTRRLALGLGSARPSRALGVVRLP